MVEFHKIAAGKAVVNWWDNGANQIAFGRGNKGFVVINRESKRLKRVFETSLPQGWYCDITTGNYIPDPSSCSSTAIYVDQNGNAEFSVGPMASAAIHINAKSSLLKPEINCQH